MPMRFRPRCTVPSIIHRMCLPPYINVPRRYSNLTRTIFFRASRMLPAGPTTGVTLLRWYRTMCCVRGALAMTLRDDMLIWYTSFAWLWLRLTQLGRQRCAFVRIPRETLQTLRKVVSKSNLELRPCSIFILD